MRFGRGVEASLSKAARNERRKIRANFMNGLAIASVAIGYLTPVAAGYLRPGFPTLGETVPLVLLILASFAGAFEFHSTALREASKIED